MHIPLVIAIFAVLALALLPVLDRSTRSEINTKGLRVYLIRIARWTRE
jgi:type II secretory pathway pseudopilin PulG